MNNAAKFEVELNLFESVEEYTDEYPYLSVYKKAVLFRGTLDNSLKKGDILPVVQIYWHCKLLFTGDKFYRFFDFANFLGED
jgi:hypothetical protein